MQTDYDPTAIEPKWQKKWEDKKVHEVDLAKAKNPYYTHVMFPYPSGDRLHIGHWYNYGPADSFARFMRMQGHEVFSPMGFDAFGLPAENYAVKTGVHPDKSTSQNVENMIGQLKRIGCMYDWNHMVNSSKPEYYKWTQWLFLQMFKNDLAYKKEATVNFCTDCMTVLANEQVQEGTCERCGKDVVQKPLTQWYWKTTQYSQELLDGLEDLDWPQKTKTMQKNWIGRSEGVRLKQKIKGLDIEVESYDSVPQTYMAQTFAVIAPEHPLIEKLVEGTEHEKPVKEFVDQIMKKKASKKFNVDEDIEGIFTGRYIDNPFGTGDLPIWVCSFVVMDYGTGMVNCSAHDDRDFAFAKKYDIPLRPVMFPADEAEAEKVKNLEYCYMKATDGILQQPEEFAGRGWAEVREDIIDYMVDKGIAERAVQFRLRDWCISRQRYWGAPIPIVYDPDGKPHPVPEEHLPWTLPTDVDFKPTGEAPLGQSKELLERTEKIFGKGWTPEIDTMDTFVCSSYYSFMYLASQNDGEYKQRDVSGGSLVDPAIAKKWMPVDCYIGGAEHACMHLIYARFVSMALKDFGFVSEPEQYKRLVHQGIITNQGAKMSKSKGNVVSPDSFVDQYGSDVFRMYLMFMGPFTQGGDWSDTGIKGVSRFVKKIWRVFADTMSADCKEDSSELTAKLHHTIKKVTGDIDRMHFNTALAALMECMNLVDKQDAITIDAAQTFAKLLAPLAPHLAEELWELTGGKGFVIDQAWPTYDESLLVSDTMTIAIQINGKVRGQIEVDADATEADVLVAAKAEPNVQKYLEGADIKKEIYVPGKLVSLVL